MTEGPTYCSVNNHLVIQSNSFCAEMSEDFRTSSPVHNATPLTTRSLTLEMKTRITDAGWAWLKADKQRCLVCYKKYGYSANENRTIPGVLCCYCTMIGRMFHMKINSKLRHTLIRLAKIFKPCVLTNFIRLYGFYVIYSHTGYRSFFREYGSNLIFLLQRIKMSGINIIKLLIRKFTIIFNVNDA